MRGRLSFCWSRTGIFIYGDEYADSGGASGDGVGHGGGSDSGAASGGFGDAAVGDAGGVRLSGHAIECRINAENPAKNFRPCPGKITEMHLPGGFGVRVDTAAYDGYVIPAFYDSMLAKLIVHGRTREEAIARMRSALGEVVIEGVDTNVDYLYSILNEEEYLAGRADIEFVERLTERL